MNRGASVPDGFSVWHHLDANGIRFKSITPQDDVLLIKFDSRAQSAAAKVVLDRTLPHGYIIAQQEDESQPAAAVADSRYVASVWIITVIPNLFTHFGESPFTYYA